MKKMLTLVLVLAVACGASAVTIGLQPIAAGSPGSATNPLALLGTIQIFVTSDGGLLGLDTILTVTSGLGTITDGMKPADCATYGWDASFPCPPVITGATAEIGGATFTSNVNPIVGYYTFRCDGTGDVVVTLSAGTAFGGSFDTSYGTPTIGGSLTIYQVPEPITMSLLGLGGLFLRRHKRA